MTKDQEAVFAALIAQRVVGTWVIEQPLRDLIEKIEEAAYERGKLAGASPFDGSHPKD